MANDDSTIGWAKMLALVAGVTGAGSCLFDGTPSRRFDFPPGHPCEKLCACGCNYLELPDGAAAFQDPDGGVPDGGQLKPCGVCGVSNG